MSVQRQRFDGPGPAPVLAYGQMLSRLSNSEFNRERGILAALPQTPNTQLRQALWLGQGRGQQDLGRAIGLLESILKSNDPAAVGLHPLARLLADNYQERQKLEAQFERQGSLLKESQRKAGELQEKLDGLADIERTLPPRGRSGRLGNSGRPTR